jgi:glycosyltransferase involved in cell wall biosynthesis
LPRAALVLAVSPWNEPKRLRRQLAELLSAERPVVYATLPWGRRKPAHDAKAVDGGVLTVSLRGPLTPLRWLLRNPRLRGRYEARLSRRLLRMLDGHPPIACALTFTPLYPQLLGALRDMRRLYVANDDHTLMSADPREAERLRQSEAETISACDAVVTVSEGIARRLRAHGKPVHVTYPGHDSDILPLERFETPRVARSVCFLGYIDWRVDFGLLRHLLDRGFHVTLIGPKVATEAQVAELLATYPESFEWQAPIPAEGAPASLARFEVLVMPYLFRSDEQAGLVELPNKLFIYFSALRPVVATYMPNLQLVEPGLVYLSRSSEEFIANCTRASSEDSRAYAERRRQVALQNTWEARRVELRAIVEGVAAPTAASPR